MGDERAKRAELTTMTAAMLARTLLAGEAPIAARSEKIDRVSGVQTVPDFGPPMLDTSAGRYVLVRELGRGGMGKVDEVFDSALGRSVAQKMVLHGEGEQSATLLVAEAQTCAQLEHPSIVPVYDVGSDASGNPYYTMRVVPGRTLRSVLDGQRAASGSSPETRTLSQLLGILRQVCLAVDYAHSRGVVHRDLKPENVIVGEFGEVYVLDWGVAHVLEGSNVKRATHQAFIAGSPGYMAPEQMIAGRAIDARTDVFALGVMLYEILAGMRPFEDVDSTSVRDRMSRNVEVPPSTRLRGIPDSFDRLTLACLSHEPSSRPASARTIADAIDRYLDVERERVQRDRDAATHTAEGEAALDAFQKLDDENRRLRADGEARLGKLALWEPVEHKQPAWDLVARADGLAAEAARALARAEIAFARALGRVADHRPARRGLASLHYRQFVAAERHADAEKMAQHLDLARTYDDGALSLELADQGELIVDTVPRGAQVMLARYAPQGLRLCLGEDVALGASPAKAASLMTGSYLVTVLFAGRAIRYPIVIQRALTHRLVVRDRGPLPEEMILVPGGPFLAPTNPTAQRFAREALPDFAIARFPVTLREYARWLDTLEADERGRRTRPWLMREAEGRWRLAPDWIAEGSRHRIPEHRALELPACEVSWYEATAYARWMATTMRLPYRLPTTVEWDKAARGADGRLFPMAQALDASFAKLRESRPEFTQPELIGAFPLDESPYGVRDLAGGVGDWTATMDDGGSAPAASDEGIKASDDRPAVWRGCSWSMSAGTRSAMRSTQQVFYGTAWIGFRLALSLDPEQSSSLTVEPMDRPAPTTQRS